MVERKFEARDDIDNSVFAVEVNPDGGIMLQTQSKYTSLSAADTERLRLFLNGKDV